MTWSDDELSAFRDGRTDAALTRKIEAAIAADPRLAARAGRLEAGGATGRSADILAFKPKPKARPAGTRKWSKLAGGTVAALVIGAAILMVAYPRDHLAAGGGGTEALAPGAALSAALDRTVRGTPAAVGSETLAIAMSFRSADGRLCRRFRLRGGAGAGHDGVACHGRGGWRIEGWMTGSTAADTPVDAAGAAMVDRLGVAQVLDEAGEAAAIKTGWRQG